VVNCKPCAGNFGRALAGLLQSFSELPGDRMSTASRLLHIDRETRNAFNELLLMEQLSTLPVGSLLRVLQTIPSAVLEAAQERAAKV
jgi:hypothetical protein